MQLVKDRIRKDGKIKAGNVLKVDSFLNHQMDITPFGEIGKEFKRRFADVEVNKILTIEASGIGIACIVAQYFDVPVVFAKKTQTKNIAGEVYTSKVESFTHGRVYDIIVSKEFLGKGDKVLLIDDFLNRNLIILLRFRIHLRIAVIDSVNCFCKKHCICFNLNCTENSSCIC